MFLAAAAVIIALAASVAGAQTATNIALRGTDLVVTNELDARAMHALEEFSGRVYTRDQVDAAISGRSPNSLISNQTTVVNADAQIIREERVRIPDRGTWYRDEWSTPMYWQASDKFWGPHPYSPGLNFWMTYTNGVWRLKDASGVTECYAPEDASVLRFGDAYVLTRDVTYHFADEIRTNTIATQSWTAGAKDFHWDAKSLVLWKTVILDGYIHLIAVTNRPLIGGEE